MEVRKQREREATRVMFRRRTSNRHKEPKSSVNHRLHRLTSSLFAIHPFVSSAIPGLTDEGFESTRCKTTIVPAERTRIVRGNRLHQSYASSADLRASRLTFFLYAVVTLISFADGDCLASALKNAKPTKLYVHGKSSLTSFAASTLAGELRSGLSADSREMTDTSWQLSATHNPEALDGDQW